MIIDGMEIDVQKKSKKYFHIYVKAPDGRVEVSVPKRADDIAIERYVRSKLDWIKIHKSRYKIYPKEAKNYISGEQMRIWGKVYELAVREGERFSVKLEGEKIFLTVPVDASIEQKEKFIFKWYRKLLSAEIEKLLPKWEAKTGLTVNAWCIRNMHSRWGTCNYSQRKISLNLQLVKNDKICLEYVILHELTHLVERLHNGRFKAFMYKYMPNWKDVQKLLNGLID